MKLFCTDNWLNQETEHLSNNGPYLSTTSVLPLYETFLYRQLIEPKIEHLSINGPYLSSTDTSVLPLYETFLYRQLIEPRNWTLVQQEGQVALKCSPEFCLKLTYRYL